MPQSKGELVEITTSAASYDPQNFFEGNHTKCRRSHLAATKPERGSPLMPSKEQENMDGDVLGGDATTASGLKHPGHRKPDGPGTGSHSARQSPLDRTTWGQCSVVPHRRVATIYPVRPSAGAGRNCSSPRSFMNFCTFTSSMSSTLESLPRWVGFDSGVDSHHTPHKHALNWDRHGRGGSKTAIPSGSGGIGGSNATHPKYTVHGIRRRIHGGL